MTNLFIPTDADIVPRCRARTKPGSHMLLPRANRVESVLPEFEKTLSLVLATPSLGPDDTYRVVSCGRPALDSHVLTVDPQSLRPCSPGQIGEIWVSGPGVADGCYGRSAESAATFGMCLASGLSMSVRTRGPRCSCETSQRMTVPSR